MTGVVIVGTGFGCITHLRALRAAGFDVHALVGRDPDEDARTRAQRFDVPHGLTDLGRRARAPRRRRGRDRDAAAHARADRARGDRGRQARAVREAVRPRRRRGAADARRGRGRGRRAPARHRVPLGVRARRRWHASCARGEIGTPKLATFLLHIPMLADPAGEVPGWWADAAQGGGWLGAQAAHVVDQVRVMLGEIEGVSASLTQVSARDWDVEDSVHRALPHAFRRRRRHAEHESARGDRRCSARASPATRGTVWAEFDTVRVADAAGTREIPAPDDLPLVAARSAARPICSPPPTTASTRSASTSRRTRACARRSSTSSRAARCPTIRRPATFADGVAGMQVLDAIRRVRPHERRLGRAHLHRDGAGTCRPAGRR